MFKLLKTKSYVPFDCKKSIFDIDYNKLYENGRKIVLFDLDNTIIPYDMDSPNEQILTLVNKIKGIGLKVLLISNNKKSRVEIFAKACELEFISSAKKPFRKGYKRLLKTIKYGNISEVIAVGDQLMTDVLGARRMGIDCILVKAIKKKSEKWYTKINRKLENRVLNKMKRYDEITYNKIIGLEED